jgi:hypothetical protein
MNQPNIDWKELAVPEGRIVNFYKKAPQANWRFYFGGKQERNAYFQFYLENPPNCFQRWMMGKILGIYWEKV